MTGKTWLMPLEQSRRGNGHWHIEGYCAFLMGRTWCIRATGCQSEGTENLNEAGAYRSSLAMVRDYIRTEINK
jgi:hypothetical protein